MCPDFGFPTVDLETLAMTSRCFSRSDGGSNGVGGGSDSFHKAVIRVSFFKICSKYEVSVKQVATQSQKKKTKKNPINKYNNNTRVLDVKTYRAMGLSICDGMQKLILGITAPSFVMALHVTNPTNRPLLSTIAPPDAPLLMIADV
jgi:hypothetical protein